MEKANSSVSGRPTIRPGDIKYHPPKWLYVGLILFTLIYPFTMQWTGAICKCLAFVFAERCSPSEESLADIYLTAMLGMFVSCQCVILWTVGFIVKKMSRKWGTEA